MIAFRSMIDVEMTDKFVFSVLSVRHDYSDSSPHQNSTIANFQRELGHRIVTAAKNVLYSHIDHRATY